MSPPIKVIRPAKEERLIDVAERAVEQSMHLITDGDDLILCSVIPVGWRKFAVKFKHPISEASRAIRVTGAEDHLELFQRETHGPIQSAPITRSRVPVKFVEQN